MEIIESRWEREKVRGKIYGSNDPVLEWFRSTGSTIKSRRRGCMSLKKKELLSNFLLLVVVHQNQMEENIGLERLRDFQGNKFFVRT